SCPRLPWGRHTPELPRRWLPTRWVSTMPTASISAKAVVGPTKEKPRLLSSLAIATDSGEVVGTSASERGAGVRAGWKDQMRRGRPPSARRETVAAAVRSVGTIFARQRMDHEDAGESC